MKLLALIGRFRELAEDTEEPYLWPDAFVAAALARAEQEACIRARLLPDSSTPSVCQIPLVAGQRVYQLHPALDVLRAAFLDGRPLVLSSLEEQDEADPRWESRTGRPQAVIREGERTLICDRTPTLRESGLVINMRVFRLPLAELSVTDMEAEPEIERAHHEELVHWALWEAYGKKDSETLDRPRAAVHEARFTAYFGVKRDENVRRKHRDRRPPVVRMNRGW